MVDVLGGVGSLINTGASLYTSAKNLQFQRDNLNWQKQVQNTTWQREDDAVQRRAIDLQRAGMSPLLAAGGAANAGQVVSTQAPQMQTPQIDVSALINAMTQSANIKKTEMDTAAQAQQMEFNAANQQLTNAILKQKAEQALMDTLIQSTNPLLDKQKGMQLAKNAWDTDVNQKNAAAAAAWQAAQSGKVHQKQAEYDAWLNKQRGLRSSDQGTLHEDLRLRSKQADTHYIDTIIRGAGTFFGAARGFHGPQPYIPPTYENGRRHTTWGKGGKLRMEPYNP